MDRIIRKDFPEHGDDVFVALKNPALCPVSRLTPDREPRKRQGQIDKDDARRIGAEMLVWFVHDWCVPPVDEDIDWDSDDDVLTTDRLGPPSVDAMLSLPADIELWIANTVQAAALPS